ncbi:MAG: hypothetical protein Q4F81_05165 [Eubacteriales bacterium]|nr:hypothetical protein [Eubacteriales bacterium]
MVLTKDRYEQGKTDFLEKYRGEIETMLCDKFKEHMKEKRKQNNLKYFIRNYTGGFILLLIVAYFGWCRELFTLSEIAVFSFLQIITLGFAYGGFESDIKYYAAETFPHQSLVTDFVFDKFIRAVNESSSEEEFNNIVQFYAVALHDIPRSVSFLDYYKHY